MLLFHLTANQAGLWPPTLSNQLQMWVVVLFRINPMAFGCVIWDLKGLNPVAPGGTWRHQKSVRLSQPFCWSSDDSNKRLWFPEDFLD